MLPRQVHRFRAVTQRVHRAACVIGPGVRAGTLRGQNGLRRGGGVLYGDRIDAARSEPSATRESEPELGHLSRSGRTR